MTDPNVPDDDLKALEREVGDLIAEAESLGEQLAAEVGSSPAARNAAKDDNSFDDQWQDDDIAGKLAEAEAAVKDAADQIGSAAPAEAPAAPAKPAKKISLPPKGAAPANAPAPAPSGAAISQPAPASPASPAPAQEARPRPAGKVALPPKRAAAPAADGPEQLVAGWVDDPVVSLPPKPGVGQRVRGFLQFNGARRVLGVGAKAFVVACECVDRPFQRIGYGMRAALGWCALALATAAVAVYLFVVR